MATIGERIGTDIITAMKARESRQAHHPAHGQVRAASPKKSTSASRSPTPKSRPILTTLLKQRRESVEQFTKGNRPELAAKEQAEIGIIDAYMPQAAGEDEIRAIVHGAIEHVTADAAGTRPGPKDMGTVMKVVQQRLLADGIRADGKMVSEMVKAELAK